MSHPIDPTSEVAKLRFLRDTGDITEREYLHAGALVFGEQPSRRREFTAIGLLIAFNCIILTGIVMIVIG